MVDFKTIVIFDLETTGLPQFEHNCTKITELSLVACLKSHCEGCDLPRVINKLTLGINPMKMITPKSSEVSGLENELLEEMKPFDDGVVSMMKNFLIRLPQPICIVAHNGNKFDFPIIMKYLLKYNCDFINGIYCADSYLAFKEFLSKNEIKIGGKEDANETITIEPRNNKEAESAKPKMRKLNESTPETKTVPCNVIPSKRISKANVSVCRKLNFSDKENDSENNMQSKCEANELPTKPTSSRYRETNHASMVRTCKTLRSYKLQDIYDFLHDGHSYTFHKSEEDCLALLSCIIQYEISLHTPDWPVGEKTHVTEIRERNKEIKVKVSGDVKDIQKVNRYVFGGQQRRNALEAHHQRLHIKQGRRPR